MRGTVPAPARQSMQQMSNDLIVDPEAHSLGLEALGVQSDPMLTSETNLMNNATIKSTRTKPLSRNEVTRFVPPSTLRPEATPPNYSDLVARIGRIEHIQHSRLLKMEKVCVYCLM